MLEQQGFHVLGPQEIAPELVMPDGPIGTRVPNDRDRADIARGLALLAANSPFDIGQAVVVADNQVLAVEGPEGTDQAVARVAELRRSGRIRTPSGIGVLVKAPKIGQDHRLDLPTIGPQPLRAPPPPNWPASPSSPAAPSWQSRSGSPPQPTRPACS